MNLDYKNIWDPDTPKKMTKKSSSPQVRISPYKKQSTVQLARDMVAFASSPLKTPVTPSTYKRAKDKKVITGFQNRVKLSSLNLSTKVLEEIKPEKQYITVEDLSNFKAEILNLQNGINIEIMELRIEHDSFTEENMRMLKRIEKLDFSVMNSAEEKFDAMAHDLRKELVLTKRKNSEILAKFEDVAGQI